MATYLRESHATYYPHTRLDDVENKDCVVDLAYKRNRIMDPFECTCIVDLIYMYTCIYCICKNGIDTEILYICMNVHTA